MEPLRGSIVTGAGVTPASLVAMLLGEAGDIHSGTPTGFSPSHHSLHTHTPLTCSVQDREPPSGYIARVAR